MTSILPLSLRLYISQACNCRMSATLQTATLATLIQFNMWSMPSQIKLQVSLQSNYFNLLLVHKGHSKSLFGWNRTSQTSMAAVTSTSRSMRYQLPVNNCLQNRASLSNFPIKFAKIKPMNSAQHICEHSRVLGQWLGTSNWSHVVRKPIRMSEDFGGQMNIRSSFLWTFLYLLYPE